MLTILPNGVDPDEILLYAYFHRGLHCLPKYPVWVSSMQRVIISNLSGRSK